jgi:hypothetical protein
VFALLLFFSKNKIGKTTDAWKANHFVFEVVYHVLLEAEPALLPVFDDVPALAEVALLVRVTPWLQCALVRLCVPK